MGFISGNENKSRPSIFQQEKPFRNAVSCFFPDCHRLSGLVYEKHVFVSLLIKLVQYLLGCQKVSGITLFPFQNEAFVIKILFVFLHVF